ncbi:hypothetical protein ACEWY4_001292 [Coilia grayii]|uniref:Uncharacterized protein n=1 Tax=Coilia grayii TaxID=363190 RepID=A0ABD1KSH8_9TELE
MIKRVRRNSEALHITLSKQKHNLALPTNAEYEKLAKLEKLLEPCRYITELLGGDKYVSCSVVLPALCHLQHAMKISDDDPAYIVRFKAAFTKDLNQWREKLNLEWLKMATALDPRFKDLKCLPRADREPVCAKLSELVKGEEPALQPLREENPEPPKKKIALLLMGSESESDEETPEDNTVERYKVEPSASLDQCPLKWWSEHTAVYGKADEQKIADLPLERILSDLPPFTNVGLDYFGLNEVGRGRSTIKRRGQVKRIRSDNGTNLVGTHAELKKALMSLNERKIQDALLS